MPCSILSHLSALWNWNISAHCRERSTLELLTHSSWEGISLQTSASLSSPQISGCSLSWGQESSGHWCLNFHLLLQQGCSCTSGITHRFPAPTPPGAEVGAAHPALGYPNTPPAFQKMPLQGSAFSWLGSIPVHTQGIPPYSTGQPGKFPSWWQIPLKFPTGAAGPESGALELETRSVVAAPVGKTRDLQALERMKEPLWSPEAAPCHPFNSVHTFPGREAKFLPRDWRHCARTAVTSATTQDLVVT